MIRKLLVTAAGAVMVLATSGAAHAAISTRAGSGPYYIRSVADSSQVFDDRASAGTDLWTYTFHGRDNQQWYLTPYVPGVVRIVPKSNTDQCATAAAPEGPIPLRACNGTNNQLWQEHQLGPDLVLFESLSLRNQCIAYVTHDGAAELRTCGQVPEQTWHRQNVPG